MHDHLLSVGFCKPDLAPRRCEGADHCWRSSRRATLDSRLVKRISISVKECCSIAARPATPPPCCVPFARRFFCTDGFDAERFIRLSNDWQLLTVAATGFLLQESLDPPKDLLDPLLTVSQCAVCSDELTLCGFHLRFVWFLHGVWLWAYIDPSEERKVSASASASKMFMRSSSLVQGFRRRGRHVRSSG